MSDLYLPQIDESGFTSALFINVPKFGSNCSTPKREKDDLLNFSHLSISGSINQGNSDKKQIDTSVRCWLSKDLLSRLDMDIQNPTNENSSDELSINETNSNKKNLQETEKANFNKNSMLFIESARNQFMNINNNSNNINNDNGSFKQIRKLNSNIDIVRKLNFDCNSPIRKDMNTSNFYMDNKNNNFNLGNNHNNINCNPLFSMNNNYIEPISNGWTCYFCNFFNFNCK